MGIFIVLKSRVNLFLTEINYENKYTRKLTSITNIYAQVEFSWCFPAIMKLDENQEIFKKKNWGKLKEN